ncbi:hypothetical protein HN385_05135 [archaeon]|jgi:hypothetical protein|nr:hypothetical protein [archaeon]
MFNLYLILIITFLAGGIILGFKPEFIFKKKINYFHLYIFFSWVIVKVIKELIYDNLLITLMSIFVFGSIIGLIISRIVEEFKNI